jgi:hypothetical protein
MRFRYTPGYMGAPVNPERCAASIHGVGSFYQCRRKRVEGDWCKQHAPLSKKGTGKKLWSTKIEREFGDGVGVVELHSMDVVKETPKQYKLATGHAAFGYKTTLNKANMGNGGRFNGAIFTDPRSALLWLEDDLVRLRERLRQQITDVEGQLQQTTKLLEEHPEEA